MRKGPIAASLAGRVLDPADRPVPGASIYWVSPRHEGRETVDLLFAHRRGVTDGEGRFWAVDLPAGPGIFVPDLAGTFLVEGHSLRIGHGTRLRVPGPAGEVVVRFPRVPADYSRLNGRLVDAGGEPVAGRRILVVGPEDPPVARGEGRTDATGAFELRFLPPGPCRALVFGDRSLSDGAFPLQLRGGSTATVNATVPPRPAGERYVLEVRVLDPLGLPVPGARVTALLRNTEVPEAVAAADGTARIGDLPVPPFGAIAQAPGRRFASAGAVARAGGVYEAEIGFAPVVGILLTVKDEETGEPLRLAAVSLLQEGFEEGNRGETPPPGVRPPARRKFVVFPGPLRIRADLPGYESADLGVEVPPEAEGPVPIEVRLRREPEAPATRRGD